MDPGVLQRTANEDTAANALHRQIASAAVGTFASAACIRLRSFGLAMKVQRLIVGRADAWDVDWNAQRPGRKGRVG